MNNNKYYITVSFISCNTYTYSYVITIIVYQMYPNYNQIKSTPPVVKKKKKNHLQARARVNRIRISRTLIKVNVFSN